MTATDASQSLENLKLERDAIVLYDALAAIEKDGRRASAFRTIAGNERRHAEVWAAKLREQGIEVPPPAPPRMRVRAIIALARLFGTRAVSDLVQALEGDEESVYGEQSSPEVEAIAADERRHAEMWRELGEGGARGGAGARRRPTLGALAPAGVEDLRAAHAAAGSAEIGQLEQWHRAGQSGTLRAVIFGVSDGLVSNTSLVMGVAGAASGDPRFILLAGIAGLLAGSFSMAAGEYISMQSQRELFERQIHLEREELRAMPEEEEAELAAIYRAKGFTPDEARTIAHRLFRDPEAALDTLVREELGLDPDDLGSPWGAAGSSFATFAVGAFIPVVPFFFLQGTPAMVVASAASAIVLAGVGGLVGFLAGTQAWKSGARMVGLAALAGGATWFVGRLFGAAVG